MFFVPVLCYLKQKKNEEKNSYFPQMNADLLVFIVNKPNPVVGKSLYNCSKKK